MSENLLHHPQSPEAEAGALTQVVTHADQQLIFFSPDAAEKIRRLVQGSGIVESALHD